MNSGPGWGSQILRLRVRIMLNHKCCSIVLKQLPNGGGDSPHTLGTQTLHIINHYWIIFVIDLFKFQGVFLWLPQAPLAYLVSPNRPGQWPTWTAQFEDSVLWPLQSQPQKRHGNSNDDSTCHPCSCAAVITRQSTVVGCIFPWIPSTPKELPPVSNPGGNIANSGQWTLEGLFSWRPCHALHVAIGSTVFKLTFTAYSLGTGRWEPYDDVPYCSHPYYNTTINQIVSLGSHASLLPCTKPIDHHLGWKTLA